MKKSNNVIDCIYQHIDQVYGNKQKNEYFTLVYKGPQIHMEHFVHAKFDSMSKHVEEDALTNCLCAPYQVVYDVLPYTFSSRLQYVLSNWISTRQLSRFQDGTLLYQDENTFYMSVQDELHHAHKVEQGLHEDVGKDHIEELKKEYSALYALCKMMSISTRNQNHTIYGFGEDELEEAKNKLKSQKFSIPNGGYSYPVECYPKNWGEQLTTSFSKVDTLPSMHYIIKHLFKLGNEIELYIKKLLFYAPSDHPTFEHLRIARKELIDALSTLTKGCFSAHDIKLIFLIGPIYSKRHTLSAQSMKSLMQFFHSKTKIKQVQRVLYLQESMQNVYWNSIQEITTLTFSESIYGELCSHLQKQFMEWTLWKNHFTQKNNATFTKKSLQQNLLPTTLSQPYDTFTYTGLFESFFEESTLLQESDAPSGLYSFFGQSIPYGINEEKMRKVTFSLGFQFTQVTIKRPWLTEKVFDFSYAYQRLCHAKISQDTLDLNLFKRKVLLSSYPIRMVIAKDITIHLECKEDARDVMEIIKKRAMFGNGFLCFQEDVNTQPPHIEYENNIMTLRYSKAYVIGYFMRITPKDKSKKGGIQHGK